LTQIIVEQEQKGQNLLPISFLRQLIGFYGDSMQFLVPGYLEQAMTSFARNQDQMRDTLRATFGIFPFGQFEQMGKQNMALFEQALKMLSPYGREAAAAATAASPAARPPAGAPAGSARETEDPRLRRLEAQVDTLRQQLEALGRDRKDG
jgi:polyhydroxyalkanoate synthesis regulator protein